MRYIFYWYFFRILLGNPLLALILLGIIYLIVDRHYIGLLPDIFKPFKRKKRINELKENVKLNPANVNGYKELGEMFLEEKKYQEAANYLEKTLNKMGEYADIHFYLGKAYYLQGLQEEGINQLNQALQINLKVGYGEPYLYLLEYHLAKGTEENKIAEFLQRLEDFGTPEILYKAGKILGEKGDARAKEFFQKGIDNYKAIPGNFKKIHRRWAWLAKLKILK